MTRRGFSLLEVVSAIAILAIVLAIGFGSTRGGESRARARALAERVAGELKVARQMAIARKVPVAVVFPGQAGSVPHSQSLYLVGGNEHPRILRVASFAAENPDSYIFVGHWPLTAGTNVPGTGALGSNGSQFNLASWALPRPGDYAIVFTPSGGVVSDRVAFDEAYHIVICEGASWTPAAVGSTASFALSQVFAPHTVTVTKTGTVSVSPGLISGDPQVVANDTLPMSGPAPPPSVPALGNTPPTVTVTFSPQPNPATLQPGADAAIDLSSGSLTLVVLVNDAEGDPVEIAWSSDRGGAFSSAPVSMEWDETAGAWRSVWTWVPPPPPALAPTDIVTLTCTVTDGRGASTNARVGAAGKVEVTRYGKIAFDSNRDGGAAQIYVMNGDGTNQRRITGADNNLACFFIRPRFSPDGTRIVCESCYFGGGNLVVMNQDGTGLHALTDVGGPGAWAAISDCISPSWSADGTRISFLGQVAGGYRSFWINADGSTPSNPSLSGPEPLGGTSLVGQLGATSWRPDDISTATAGFVLNLPSGGFHQLFEQRLDGTRLPLTSSTWDQNDAACSPDGSRLAFESTEGSSRDIWVASYAPGVLGARTNLTNDTFSEWAPTWSPDGSKIAFTSDRTGGSDVFVMRSDGTQVVQLTTSPAVDKNPCWAP